MDFLSNIKSIQNLDHDESIRVFAQVQASVALSMNQFALQKMFAKNLHKRLIIEVTNPEVIGVEQN